MSYLWDTNIVIYYLQQQFPPDAEKYIDGVIAISLPAISAITEIELICWKTNTEDDILVVTNFMNKIHVFELEHAIKQKTAELRKSYRIKLPDAIIAATALVHDLTLLSRNVQDFDKIEGLKLINPFDQ